MFWDRKKEEMPTGGGGGDTGRTIRQTLTPELQNLVDREEELLGEVYEGQYA